MVFSIYKPPESAEQTWGELKTGDIPDAVDFEYTRCFCGTGTFSLTVPRTTLYADKIEVGCILILPDNDEYIGLIVKNIKRLNDVIKITGNDLNGLLDDRLTVAQTEDGKDAQSGATETIVKHYVSANCTEEAVDVGRVFPCLAVAEDLSRGTQNDAAAPRLARVSDTIADILGAAKMGYRISPDFSSSRCRMIFDVIEQTDRTIGQHENSSVCFAYGHGNVSEMTRETGVTSNRNTFYCQLSDGLVTRYDKKSEVAGNEEAEAAETTEDTEETAKYSGYQRREEYLDLNCELSEIEVYADHQIADRFQETDSLEIVAGNPLDYGTDYNVGDVITVYDRARSVQLDSVISAAEIKRTANEYSVKITLGSSKPKPIDKVNKNAAALAASLKQPAKTPGKLYTKGSLAAAKMKEGDFTLAVGTVNGAGDDPTQFNYASFGTNNGTGIRIENFFRGILLDDINLSEGNFEVRGDSSGKLSSVIRVDGPKTQTFTIGAFKFTFTNDGVYIYNTVKNRGALIAYTS